MQAHLLVLHRKENYSGEFAPEIVAVCDEMTMDENPQWWDDEVVRQRAAVGNDANAWATVTIDVPTDDLLAALYPNPRVAATIVSSQTLPDGDTDGDTDESGAPAAQAGGIQSGSWVLDIDGPETEAASYGLVTAVVADGYCVTWAGATVAKFAHAEDVTAVTEVPRFVMRAVAKSLGSS